MIRVADSLFSGWFCGRTLHAPTIWPRLRRPFFDPLPQAPYRHQGSVRSPLVGGREKKRYRQYPAFRPDRIDKKKDSKKIFYTTNSLYLEV